MNAAQCEARTRGEPVAVSLAGPLGQLDLMVPESATAKEVARVYDTRFGVAGASSLRRLSGALVDADRPIAESGVRSGGLLLVEPGSVTIAPGASIGQGPGRHARRRGDGPMPPRPALTWWPVGVAAACSAASAGLVVTTAAVPSVVVSVLMVVTGCLALSGVGPGGRRGRVNAAPVVVAALVISWLPGMTGGSWTEGWPRLVVVASLGYTLTAAVGWLLAGRDDGLAVQALAGLVWGGVGAGVWWTRVDSSVAWTVLLLVAMTGSWVGPRRALPLPAPLVIDASSLGLGGRHHLTEPAQVAAALVTRGRRVCVAAAGAALATVAVAAPLVMWTGPSRGPAALAGGVLVLAVGAVLALAPRTSRSATARLLGTAAGGICLLSVLASPVLASWWPVAACWVVGSAVVVVTVVGGSGRRPVLWSRAADLTELVGGALAVVAAAVTSGLARSCWAMTAS